MRTAVTLDADTAALLKGEVARTGQSFKVVLNGAARVALADARRVVDGRLGLPQARILTPSARHFSRVMDLMTAAMAAYAIGNRARLFPNDTDFARFPGLDWRNPLACG